MCKRYIFASEFDVVEKEFQIDTAEVRDSYKASYNICSGDMTLVIPDDNPRKAQLFRFGYTPSWAKYDLRKLNARSEGDRNKDNNPHYKGASDIISKPLWRKSIRSKRCLVLANAFIIESRSQGRYQPFIIYKNSSKRPFVMAGIWDEWINQYTGQNIRSFAIITTPAPPLIQLIPHDRCPLVLSQNEERLWISNSLPLHAITPMLRPFKDYEFNGYQISSAIQLSQNKSRDMLRPVSRWIRSEYHYVLENKLQLQGMGQTSARRRRAQEDDFLKNLNR